MGYMDIHPTISQVTGSKASNSSPQAGGQAKVTNTTNTPPPDHKGSTTNDK